MLKFICNKKTIFSIVCIIIVLLLTMCMLYIGKQYFDKDILKERYELKVRRCELLEEVVKNSVNIGEGIDKKAIPSEYIEYEITFKSNKDIYIFHYWIKDYNEYNAQITLSSDYKIIEEEYSQELETSFEEYMNKKTVSFIFIILMFILFYVLAFFAYKDFKPIFFN